MIVPLLSPVTHYCKLYLNSICYNQEGLWALFRSPNFPFNRKNPGAGPQSNKLIP